jgi:surface antigen
MATKSYYQITASSVAAFALTLGAVPASAIGDPAKAPQTAKVAAVDQAYPDETAQRGGFLGNVFGCSASGNKQIIGAGGGAVLGGLLGNQIAGRGSRALGTILGGVLGSAAGSWLGCKLQRNDQVKAQRAVERAAVEGKDQTWSSDESGASGDVKVSQGTTRTDLSGITLASGVEPATAYDGTSGAYVATTTANVRSAPSTNGKILSRIPSGSQIWVPAGVKNAPWLLVSQDGVGQGYVSAPLLRKATTTVASRCRMIEHTVHTPGADAETEKLQACPDASGKWVMTRT